MDSEALGPMGTKVLSFPYSIVDSNLKVNYCEFRRFCSAETRENL